MSIAGIALGVLAFGGLAIGYLASGGAAIAYMAADGGLAIASKYAVGGSASAEHANDSMANNFINDSAFFNIAETLDLFIVSIIVIGSIYGIVKNKSRRDKTKNSRLLD